MQVRMPLVAGALVLVGALSAALFAPRGEAAVPPEAIGSSYSGKGISKTSPIGEIEGGKGGFLANVEVYQEGNDILMVITIDPDGDSEVWSLEGRYGNGNFWVAGSVNEGDFVTITGTAKGAPGKLSLKGSGSYLASDHFSDIKFGVKELVDIK